MGDDINEAVASLKEIEDHGYTMKEGANRHNRPELEWDTTGDKMKPKPEFAAGGVDDKFSRNRKWCCCG